MTGQHPSLPHLRRAHDELLLARLELRTGRDEYRAERMEVDEMILIVEATIADVMLRDVDIANDESGETLAWSRQTRGALGKPVVGGL